MKDWIKCSDALPPDKVEVETKIDDVRGKRNIARLRRRGCLWFFTDMSMYVHYEPTHWREIENINQQIKQEQK